VTRRFPCSAESRLRADPIEGTASTVRAFLLVECPGPWGVEALRDARLDREVKERLQGLEAATGVRPLLIRRSGVRGRTGVRVFAAYARGQRPWLETARLGHVGELLDVDLAPLGEGRSLGFKREEEPVFLVCTHGRHDACCAERGRPLYAALAAAAPVQSWEVSHIGGDRFAPNVLVLPHGLYYGRLAPEDVSELVELNRAGDLDLAHLRGRSAYPFAVQAAEIHLRRRLGAVGIEPLALGRLTRRGAETRVVFAVEGQAWQVRVRTENGEPLQLTCSAPRATRPLEHHLVGIEPVAGP
jgi:hypothetical protein